MSERIDVERLSEIGPVFAGQGFEDAVVACADLVGRTGASSFNVGYDDDKLTLAGEPIDYWWYAEAYYKGQRVRFEGATPDVACEHLATRLLRGGTCTHCGKVTTTHASLVDVVRAGVESGFGNIDSGEAASVLAGEMADEARERGLCPWRRIGKAWVRGCEVPEGSFVLWFPSNALPDAVG